MPKLTHTTAVNLSPHVRLAINRDVHIGQRLGNDVVDREESEADHDAVADYQHALVNICAVDRSAMLRDEVADEQLTRLFQQLAVMTTSPAVGDGQRGIA